MVNISTLADLQSNHYGRYVSKDRALLKVTPFQLQHLSLHFFVEKEPIQIITDILTLIIRYFHALLLLLRRKANTLS